MSTTWLLALVLAGGAASASAGSAEDDLTVVKKAVKEKPAASPAPEARAAAEAPADARGGEAARTAPRKGKEPQWLRVRVVEKHGKKVSVNLPLALVRALGDDRPVDLACGREGRERSRLTIGEVLRALDAGQDLVQIDEEDATVRVWVE